MFVPSAIPDLRPPKPGVMISIDANQPGRVMRGHPFVRGILQASCSSEVCSAVIQSVAVDVINSFGIWEDHLLHRDILAVLPAPNIVVVRSPRIATKTPRAVLDQRKINLIEAGNPEWSDLYDDIAS